jgi:4-amino-4-deoxy-L-arabinose transferase-like glycosyltransferase
VAGVITVRLGELASLLTMTVLGLGAVLALVHLCEDRAADEEVRDRLLRWTVAAFAAHLAFGLAVTKSAALTHYLGPDALTYHSIAGGIANHWSSGTGMPRLSSGREGFFYLLAGLYWLFGPHMAAGMALNAALGAGLVPLVTDTTRRLFGRETARWAAPLMLLLPGLFLWTSQLLKEAPVLFLIAAACNCSVRLSGRSTVMPVLMLATSIGLLLSFRGPVGLVLGAGVVAGLVVGRRELAHGVAAGVAVVGFMGAFVLIGGVGQAGYEQTVTSSLEDASRTRQSLAGAAASGFGADLDTSTSRRALVYLPVGLFNFTFGPFPWQGGASRQLAALPDVIVWWWLLPALWDGYREARRRIGRRVLTVVLPALTIWLLLALVIGNFGIVSREREQVVVVVAPLLALGLARRSDRRAEAVARRPPVTVRRTAAAYGE